MDASVEELMNVEGIGKKKAEDIKKIFEADYE
jgi:ERCC4-type nuclease